MTFHRLTYSETVSAIVGVSMTELATEKRPMFKFEQEVRVVLKVWTGTERRPR